MEAKYFDTDCKEIESTEAEKKRMLKIETIADKLLEILDKEGVTYDEIDCIIHAALSKVFNIMRGKKFKKD